MAWRSVTLTLENPMKSGAGRFDRRLRRTTNGYESRSGVHLYCLRFIALYRNIRGWKRWYLLGLFLTSVGVCWIWIGWVVIYRYHRWPGSGCFGITQQCAVPKNVNWFTIHGLWPERYDNTWVWLLLVCVTNRLSRNSVIRTIRLTGARYNWVHSIEC